MDLISSEYTTYKDIRVLALEDKEDRGATILSTFPNVLWVRTARDCINELKTKPYDIVTLDHDLNQEVFVDSNREDCGMEVVRWLVKQRMQKQIRVVVHSHNLPVSEKMVSALKTAGYLVEYEPFGLGTFWEKHA